MPINLFLRLYLALSNLLPIPNLYVPSLRGRTFMGDEAKERRRNGEGSVGFMVLEWYTGWIGLFAPFNQNILYLCT